MRMPDAAMPTERASDAPAGTGDAAPFDFAESAELFTRRERGATIAAGTNPADADRARSRATYRNGIAYRRFASAAEAIRFAMEMLPPRGLEATVLVVNGERHETAAIRA